MTRNIFVIEL